MYRGLMFHLQHVPLARIRAGEVFVAARNATTNIGDRLVQQRTEMPSKVSCPIGSERAISVNTLNRFFDGWPRNLSFFRRGRWSSSWAPGQPKDVLRWFDDTIPKEQGGFVSTAWSRLRWLGKLRDSKDNKSNTWSKYKDNSKGWVFWWADKTRIPRKAGRRSI